MLFRSLQELEALGVDQFAIYLMHDQQDETLGAYGRGIVPAMANRSENEMETQIPTIPVVPRPGRGPGMA